MITSARLVDIHNYFSKDILILYEHDINSGEMLLVIYLKKSFSSENLFALEICFYYIIIKLYKYLYLALTCILVPIDPLSNLFIELLYDVLIAYRMCWSDYFTTNGYYKGKPANNFFQ